MMIRQMETGIEKEVINLPDCYFQIHNFAVSRDGKKLYVVLGNTTDEIVLIKSAD